MSEVITHSVESGGVQLHVEERGEGLPVLFLHGLLSDRSIFEAQAKDMARDHRVICMDLRGCGQSGSSASFTVRDVARDAIQVLDQLQIHRAVIAGLGMGGAAALQIGLQFADRAMALILMNTSADAESGLSSLQLKGFAHLVGLLGARKELLEQAASRLFSHTCLVAYPDKVQAWLEEASGLDGKSIRAGVLALAGRDSVDMRLERITTRTLAIASSQDVLTPPHKLQQIVDRLPNARMKTIDRAGHFAPMEKPGEVIEVIRGFTKELREGVRDDRTGRILRQGEF